MGPPGAGKSTFINNATNCEPESPVGHGLSPETIKIQAFRVIRNNRPFVFIDTPGFDDVNSKVTTEQAILNLVSVKASKYKVKLACIVYLHKISDNRLTFHKARENSILFENLLERDGTGKLPYERVLLVTTMWKDEHTDPMYSSKMQREGDLQNQYWQGVDHVGQKILRFYNNPNSAWELIEGVSGLVV
ncbi:hypothetical protein BDZ94DRAFT_1171009 [Collybia nuda]|uniref:G domain-containing protein n=1 Tax=Collybia nuda TaxID=64659 RepID=A0A9P5Y026_9AGAR|nr:hypothetical protein BDZ94DRAFT_1171009 [Collybia nuda]